MHPNEIKLKLAQLGGGANKRLGQHFLIDQFALKSIVEAADIQTGERVLEIGPGFGVLTEALVACGARVTAIEYDRRFVAWLAQRSIVRTNVQVISGDAAQLDWDELMGDKPWKFVANLPYAITSLALRKALWAKHPPTRVIVLIQREVAERAIAQDGKTSLLSLMVSLASREAHIVKRVSAGAFYPPPKIESAILEITPMTWTERESCWGVDPEKIMTLAKRGFAHPRKLLASNLGLSGDGLAVFERAGIASKARAENLLPEQWRTLTISLDTP